jgi:hypothetical protein
MKKIISTVFVIFMAINVNLQAQDLKKVLNNYFDAVGMENLKNVKTISFTGKVVQGGMELPFTMYLARPMKYRMDITVQGQQIVQAFDGKNGWMVNPMMGSTEPQDLPPEQLKQMKKQADFEGELYEYEKKGSTLELIGDEDFEGTKVYKLKLTDKDGDITYYFIDAETYVVIKTNAKRNINGTEVEGETLFSNFQMIDGMAFPYSISTGMNGQTMAEIVIEKVDFSKKLDPTFFNKPEKQ